MSFVEVNQLTKHFGETKVFENLNFTIEKGEFITLLGPSGCGKSTLLRSIAGLNEITDGKIHVGNQDITSRSPKDRNISMVFQSYALFPNMTVEENIGFGLKMKKMKPQVIKEKVAHFIDLVELNGRENFYPSELSGGQQQRVALARALVIEPDILLLDEPLSALDAKIRKNLRLQIRKIQKELNITTIFVTHDQEEALIISDRIFLMDKGKFAQIGTPEEIYTNPKTEFAARFMGNYNILSSKEIKSIFEISIEDGLYAIRPEAIELTAFEKSTHSNALFIQDSIVLGSVIRHTIACPGGQSVLVDVLNKDSVHLLKSGQSVRLSIAQSEYKKVG